MSLKICRRYASWINLKTDISRSRQSDVETTTPGSDSKPPSQTLKQTSQKRKGAKMKAMKLMMKNLKLALPKLLFLTCIVFSNQLLASDSKKVCFDFINNSRIGNYRNQAEIFCDNRKHTLSQKLLDCTVNMFNLGEWDLESAGNDCEKNDSNIDWQHCVENIDRVGFSHRGAVRYCTDIDSDLDYQQCAIDAMKLVNNEVKAAEFCLIEKSKEEREQIKHDIEVIKEFTGHKTENLTRDKLAPGYYYVNGPFACEKQRYSYFRTAWSYMIFLPCD